MRKQHVAGADVPKVLYQQTWCGHLNSATAAQGLLPRCIHFGHYYMTGLLLGRSQNDFVKGLVENTSMTSAESSPLPANLQLQAPEQATPQKGSNDGVGCLPHKRFAERACKKDSVVDVWQLCGDPRRRRGHHSALSRARCVATICGTSTLASEGGACVSSGTGEWRRLLLYACVGQIFTLRPRSRTVFLI